MAELGRVELGCPRERVSLWKDILPHFTLMNETFRQFVCSSHVRDEVVKLEAQSSGAWDTLKWPFLIAESREVSSPEELDDVSVRAG
jgi:hypothetical protein